MTISNTVEWPPMANVSFDKKGKPVTQWQHCPQRETAYMRWWTSRYYPILLLLYPRILLGKDAGTSVHALYDWKEQIHHAHCFFQENRAMRDLNPDDIDEWRLAYVPAVTSFTDYIIDYQSSLR